MINRYQITYEDGSIDIVEYSYLYSMEDVLEETGAEDILFIAGGVEL